MVGPEDTIHCAAIRMADADLWGVPVLEEGRIVGVLSERDIVRNVAARGLSPSEMLVKDAMSREPVRLSDDRDVESALAVLKARGARELVVQDFAGQPIGVFCGCEDCCCASFALDGVGPMRSNTASRHPGPSGPDGRNNP